MAGLNKAHPPKNVLYSAGELAEAARAVVGGRDFITGLELSPASSLALSTLLVSLRDKVDAYDEAILEWAASHCDE